MQRLTTGTGAGRRNVEPEQKVGVSKPMMGMMNDMADAVGGVLVRVSLRELPLPHIITCGDKANDEVYYFYLILLYDLRVNRDSHRR